MQDFKTNDSWRKAHQLTLRLYREAQAFPKEEVFGLTHNVRRSAVGIATRIAEGCGRSNNADFAGDLRRAAAGCNELEYLLLLVRDLGYLNAEVTDALTTDTVEVRKMISGLLRKVTTSP